MWGGWLALTGVKKVWGCGAVEVILVLDLDEAFHERIHKGTQHSEGNGLSMLFFC